MFKFVSVPLGVALLLVSSHARAAYIPGGMYVSTRLGPSISLVGPGGTVTPFVTGIDTTGLAFGPDGYLYAAHFVNFGIGDIYKVDAAGNVSNFVTGLHGPATMAFDAAGNLFVSEFYGGDIAKVTPGGNVSIFASGFFQPGGLTFDSSGNLYAASGDGSVSKITPGGAVSIFASGFSQPEGLAFDGSGNLYVGNNGNATISKVTPGGAISTFATGFSGRPQYIAFDGSGNLWVPEYDNGRLSFVGPGGGTATAFATGLPGAESVAFVPTVVPEPSTLVLACVGAAGLWGYGWRRRRV